MKIVTLIENKPGDREELYTEYGLSMYIEVDGKNILFDTGQSGDFIDNARDLGVNLKDLDYIIISHGHYDHSGGFIRLIKEINPNIKLYLGDGFFNKKYNLNEYGEYDYVGNVFEEDFLRENKIPTEYIKEDMKNITENLLVFTNFNRNEDFENTNQNMYLEEDGEYKKDQFTDEISLGVKTDKGLVVLVGCSHVGIVNILNTITDRTDMKICALIGGTHLVNEDDEKINRIIDSFREKEIKLIGTCHCTGKQGEAMIIQQLSDRFVKNNTGDILII